jgi:hypothetical protein
METTNEQNYSNLSIELKKALALRKFKDVDFFVYGENAYEGTMEDAQSQFDALEEEEKQDFQQFLDDEFTAIEGIDGDEYAEIDGEVYLVLTDSEADDVWEDRLDSYLEECIYPELTGSLKNYFDDYKWKEDRKSVV